MSWFRRLWNREYRLAIVMGCVDGILTAMVLTAGRMLEHGSPIDASLVLRVAVSSLATAGFIFFVARYTEYRGRLVRAETQLNMTEHGRLAASQLGRSVLHDAMSEACISGACSFAGAALPLAIAMLIPAVPLLAIALSIGLLSILGFMLGRTVHGSPGVWAMSLLIGGVLMTVVGVQLHLV
jgi:VIT1/CCC1 family predicted Fe2+/Mn2+ transporter